METRWRATALLALGALCACGEETPVETACAHPGSPDWARPGTIHFWRYAADGMRHPPDGFLEDAADYYFVNCRYGNAEKTRLECGALSTATPFEMPREGRFGFVLTFQRPFDMALLGRTLRPGQDFEVSSFFSWVPARQVDGGVGFSLLQAPTPLQREITLTVTRLAAHTDAQGRPLLQPVARMVGTMCGGLLTAWFNVTLVYPGDLPLTGE